MKIAIYGSRRQDAHLDKLDAFLRSLDDAGHDVVMHPKLYRYLSGLIPGSLRCVRRVMADGAEAGADMAVSIGGDGTFLRTAEWIGQASTPIAGVNTGHLGYLTAVGIEGICDIVPAVINGLLSGETRSLIQIVSPKLDTEPYALNEVALLKSETAAMISVRATLDGELLADYRVDGLLISTPTGSTAYNLSVGGPIVQPSAPVWIVSPVAAHSLSMRPLVVNDSSELTLTAGGRAPPPRPRNHRRGNTIGPHHTLTLRQAPFVSKVVPSGGPGFAPHLRGKAHRGGG